MLKKSCKGSPCLALLEKEIDENSHQRLTRNEKIKEALLKAQSLDPDELKQRAIELKEYKKGLPDDIAYPTAMQVTVEEDFEKVLLEFEENLKNALSLRVLRTKYEIEILLFIYLGELPKDAMLVGKRVSLSRKEEELTGPEMVKLLVELILLDRQRDENVIRQIKSILLEWKRLSDVPALPNS